MSRAKRRTVQAVLIGLGVTMIVLGIVTGELKVILNKAIYICLECIGIG